MKISALMVVCVASHVSPSVRCMTLGPESDGRDVEHRRIGGGSSRVVEHVSLLRNTTVCPACATSWSEEIHTD